MAVLKEDVSNIFVRSNFRETLLRGFNSFNVLLRRRVAANKLNKQSQTGDEGWSSGLGFGLGANNSVL